MPGLVAFADEKTRAEVGAMLHVASHTSIRVPRVYHWGTAADNPTGLDLPFIIMEYIPHSYTLAHFLLDPALVKRPELKANANLVKEHLYRQLAKIHIQLSQIRHSSISALDIVNNRSIPGGAPIPFNLNEKVISHHVPEAIFAPAIAVGETTSTARQWHVFTANLYIAGLLYEQNPDRGVDEIRSKFVARYLYRQLALNRKLPRRPDDDGFPAEGSSEESFRLWCDDLGTHNILCNEQGDVEGVIDWEFVYFAPESFIYDPPVWLIIDQDSELLVDDRPDSEATCEQQDIGEEVDCINDGVANYHCSGFEFEKDIERNRKIFMRALQLEERELYKQDHGRASQSMRDGGSHSHLNQCEGVVEQVSALNIQDEKTAIPTPFHDHMTQRWEKQRSEYLWNFTYRMDREDFDDWYWKQLDREHGGEGSGNHHERLDLLPPRVKDLMEWFVHRRMEEREKWDPAELMEAVLGQMDGTGPFVTAVEDQVSTP